MSKERAVRSSQKFKPTSESKKQVSFKSRERPKFKSGTRPKNRSRDSGKKETIISRSGSRPSYRSSSRSSNRSSDRRSFDRRSSDRRPSSSRSSDRRPSDSRSSDRRPSDRRSSSSRSSDRRPSSSRSSDRRPSDRRSSDRRSSDRGNIELHSATCAKCKKETQVPFKPTGKKPVFCRECFQDQKPRDGSRQERRSPSRSGGRSNYQSSSRSSNRYDSRSRRPSERGNIELHSATCAKCKKETQVPFKPTGSKPVYCRECFQEQKPRDGSRQERRSPSRSGSRPSYRSSNRSSARTGDRNRRSSDRRSSDRGNVELHTAICAKCKKETQVPFKPTGSKPVYCRECFQDQMLEVESAQVTNNNHNNDGEVVERFGDRPGPYRANKRMHQTTCRTCDKEILIPFKPKTNKPIYCPDCYKKVT